MTPGDVVQAPPIPKLVPYPGAISIALLIVFSTALIFVIGKYDPTGGPLSISILVVLSFIGVAVFCLFFTIPNDEITSGVIGGLIASFGAVVAHWLGRKDSPK